MQHPEEASERTGKQTDAKYVSFVILAVVAIVLFIYSALFNAANVPFDSDYANLVLEANEMVHGNFFRIGWILSGVSFTLTDLPYFWIGAIARGLTPAAYVIAVSLMLVCLILSGWSLVSRETLKQDKAKRTSLVLIFLWVGASLNPYWQSISRAHSGSVIWAFLGLGFFARMLDEEEPRKNGTLAGVFFALSCWGDSVGLIAVVAPCALIVLIKIAQAARARNTNLVKRYARCLLIPIVSTMAGIVLDNLYFAIGGCDKNSFLESKSFVGLDQWGEKFVVYLDSIFGMCGADFAGREIFKAGTVWRCLRALVVIWIFMLVFLNIKCAICDKDSDVIGATLSVGFILLSCIFILTDISVDRNSARYLAYFPVMGAVLIVRECCRMNAPIMKFSSCELMWTSIICAGLCAASFYKAGPISTHITFSGGRDELAQTLQREGLTNGYSDFWNASSVTLTSQGKVSSRAISCSDSGPEVYRWICKSSWYTTPANFVIVDDTTSPRFGLTEEAVVSSFGEPTRTVDVSGTTYHVYVYDYDLSTKLISED